MMLAIAKMPALRRSPVPGKQKRQQPMTSAFPQPNIVDTGEIRMAVHELGEGPPVILVHGFPELAFSWRHQLPALAAAGYRAIAPDMRGYGGTDKPRDVADYTIQHLIGDLTGLMDALSIEKAVLAGHDWGAMLVWQMSLLAPERMAGLITLNIPHIPRPPINPITYMRLKLGKDFYIVNFQDSDEADRRFAEDPRRFIDTMMRRRQAVSSRVSKTPKKRTPLSLLAMLDQENPAGDPLLTEDELDFYAEAFAAGGFTGPINWYRNWKHNWKTTKRISQKVDVPALFVGATDDRIIGLKQIEAQRAYVADLEIQMIEDCGHWTQQDKPAELNAIMLEWLARRYPAS
jgi:pimeloyl-ACP methyl ester carboxylesterase